MILPARTCDRLAAASIALATLVLLAVALIAHRIPLFGVETDLLADSFPAERALSSGHFTAATFQFRGPGYPMLLASGTRLAGGDEFLAARLLNVLATAVSLAAAYLVFRGFLGPPVGLAVALGLATNPVFVRAAIEAGTDMPALALALAATGLVIRGGGGRARVAAGCLAGLAILTRTNMVFLAPAGLATLAEGPGRGRRLLLYLAGLAVPVGGWVLAHAVVTGSLPADRNYVNVAYEVYGQGKTYDWFWLQTGNAFHSIADVLRYDPERLALHVARNALTRWLSDSRELMPVWIGAPALIGMIVAWRRHPGWRTMALHAGLSYLVLTLVFYNPRFFLYLLPFYLSGTFGLLLAPPAGRTAPEPSGEPGGRPAALRLAVAAALLFGSGVVAVSEARTTLHDPPVETRIAGEWLRGIGHPGQAVMARKPHVAYFAHMTYLPIPYAERFADFLAAARNARADYLFVSPIEIQSSPQLAVLSDPDVSLPGLAPIAHRMPVNGHGFSVYQLGPAGVSEAALEDSLLAAIRRYAARRPDEAWAHTYLGGQLVTMGRYWEALAPLAVAERLDPRVPLTARFQAVAHEELGEHDAAAAACQRALALVSEGSWELGYLGQIRLAQGRYAEARDELKQAMEGAPTDARYPPLYREAVRALADSLRATSKREGARRAP